MKRSHLPNHRWRWCFCVLVLLLSLGLLSLTSGCSGSPCSDKCLKLKIKLNKPIKEGTQYSVLIHLTSQPEAPGKIPGAAWTITKPEGGFTSRKGKNGNDASEYDLGIPGLPKYLEVSFLAVEGNADAATLKGNALSIKLFLGDVWNNKLLEENGVQIWLNADQMTIGPSIHGMAIIKDTSKENNCNVYVHQSYVKVSLGENPNEFNTWDGDGNCMKSP